MGASANERKALIVGNLEGAADQWLMGQVEEWESWDYQNLKTRLIVYFGEESRTNARKLKALK